MQMRTKLLAVATLALMTLSLSAYAEDALPAEDQVSDALDIEFLCCADFTVSSMSETLTDEE